MVRKSAGTPSKTGQTVKRENDGKIHATLSDGTIVILRDAIGRDLVDISEDEYLTLSRLIIQWGDRVRDGNRSPVMSEELKSAGFLDIADAVFLKKITRKLFSPDIEKLAEQTEVQDLGKDGVIAILPSGLKIKMRRPDGCDLEQCEFPGDGDGMKISLACGHLAGLVAEEWGSESGDRIGFDKVLTLSLSDFFALTKVVSDHFFRVAEVDL